MAKHSSHCNTSDAPLYLKKISLENIRCFEKLEFDLTASGDRPRMWAVVLGDNGVGKTTLLRSIAMGLCDEASAAGLLREIYGEWNRAVGTDDKDHRPTQLEPAKIRLEFFPNDKYDQLSVTTQINPNSTGYSNVKQITKCGRRSTPFPWENIFACGYGAGRRGFGSKDIDEYATIDAVYTLFNYDVPLQNPELVLRRVEALKKDIRPVLDGIAEVLQLEPADVTLSPQGLFIKGSWGRFQPIRGVGDGFQATLAWIVDFLGWAIFYDSDAEISDVSGIVLIDELEQHLHPSWQRKIIGLLSRQFPKIQFIATTHTPMCAVGAADLPDAMCELIVLRSDGGVVTGTENIPPPKDMRADQILTSDLFGLPTTSSDDLTEAIGRYSRLKSQLTLSKKEQSELQQLSDRLRMRLGSAQTELETAVREEVGAALKRRREQSFDPQAVDYEVLRQLRKLASGT